MYEIAQMLATAFAIGLTGALAPGPTFLATVNSSLHPSCGAEVTVASNVRPGASAPVRAMAKAVARI